jgi:hypothetical protein
MPRLFQVYLQQVSYPLSTSQVSQKANIARNEWKNLTEDQISELDVKCKN